MGIFSKPKTERRPYDGLTFGLNRGVKIELEKRQSERTGTKYLRVKASKIKSDGKETSVYTNFFYVEKSDDMLKNAQRLADHMNWLDQLTEAAIKKYDQFVEQMIKKQKKILDDVGIKEDELEALLLNLDEARKADEVFKLRELTTYLKKIVLALIDGVLKYELVDKVDVFLQYEREKQEGKDIKFLEIPTVTYSGRVFARHNPAKTYKKTIIETDSGIRLYYVDAEVNLQDLLEEAGGDEYKYFKLLEDNSIFWRDEYFMRSPFADNGKNKKDEKESKAITNDEEDDDFITEENEESVDIFDDEDEW